MKINLCIFTNCIKSAPDISVVKKTYDSFCETFGRDAIENVTIYMDHHGPQRKYYKEYRNALKIIHSNVIITNSLSDGYTHAVKNNKADFLFMLEGDWIFKKDNIKHRLSLICALMNERSLYHLRFNKRNNIVKLWDKTLNEVKLENWIDGDKFHYCETPVLSNNPHIINRKLYIKKCLPFVKIVPGSKGIEENLTARKELTGCIYGGLNYPATVQHLDGRGK